jgi:hypothetical protein
LLFTGAVSGTETLLCRAPVPASPVEGDPRELLSHRHSRKHTCADDWCVRRTAAGVSCLAPQLVIGIQVFQHGSRSHAHQHLLAAADRVVGGGLLCVRVNATDTEIEYDHDRIEEAADGGYTIRYQAGPKAGLDIHFFTAAELSALVADRFTELLAPRLHITHRTPPGRGSWSQWEAIWQRRPGP